MNHPNILKCFDVYKTASQCYIVTELCSNGDLQTYMTRRGTLQEKEAIEIITQIACGVKHLFRNGIIHRDLKPANILCGPKSWKIADFGFAI
jgi:serine/threonine protein kinase